MLARFVGKSRNSTLNESRVDFGHMKTNSPHKNTICTIVKSEKIPLDVVSATNITHNTDLHCNLLAATFLKLSLPLILWMHFPREISLECSFHAKMNPKCPISQPTPHWHTSYAIYRPQHVVSKNFNLGHP